MSKNKLKLPSQKSLKDIFNHYINKRFEEAEKLAILITKKFPKHPFSWKVLGEIFRKRKKLPDSLRVIKVALEINSQDHEAHNNLGLTLGALGKSEEAKVSFQKAIELKSNFGTAHKNLGIALESLDKLEEAKVSFQKAIELKSNLDDAHYNLGKIFFNYKDYEKAEENFLLSNNQKSKIEILKCKYEKNDKNGFYKQLDYLIDKNQSNAVIGSLICRSKNKYGINRNNPFCNYPLKYLYKTNLTKKYDFENIFIKKTKNIFDNPNITYRKQFLLTNGIQTLGNIFNQNNTYMDEIKKIIYSEVENYHSHFKDSDEGFIKNWPTSFDIFAWFINMKNGGNLRAHIHESGWLSGSIYINVPPKSEINSGNLVICTDYDESEIKNEENKKTIINVVTGSLCLFPSSLLHYTIPFKSEEERMVLAFDVNPK